MGIQPTFPARQCKATLNVLSFNLKSEVMDIDNAADGGPA